MISFGMVHPEPFCGDFNLFLDEGSNFGAGREGVQSQSMRRKSRLVHASSFLYDLIFPETKLVSASYLESVPLEHRARTPLEQLVVQVKQVVSLEDFPCFFR